jgi:hypothetical protein
MGVPVADLCRKHGLSSPAFYKWKAKFGGRDVSEAPRLKALKDDLPPLMCGRSSNPFARAKARTGSPNSASPPAMMRRASGERDRPRRAVSIHSIGLLTAAILKTQQELTIRQIDKSTINGPIWFSKFLFLNR